jgi:Nif-specific regulatory protein
VVSSLISETVQRIQRVNEEKEALRQENSKLRRELSAKNRIEEIIGNSSRMQEVFDMVHRVADSNATVLLRGESGTGKTLVAKALHHNSSRAGGPFIVVNCSALPETLLESELFGHEKGAFTGATESKKGRFEMAEGGTLFLDEIGEISPAVQVKLLNVIQERTFQRLGSTKTITTDIRLVAATNRDLEKAVKEMVFREDLYYRLNVFPVYLPPLRERRTDILLLAEYFLEKYAQENSKEIKRITTPAIDLLVQYHWPGNVRELQNCMERAVLICDGTAIKSIHLPPSLQSADSIHSTKPLSLATAVENFERELIIDALKKNNGNQTKAAKSLETSLRIINYKIHSYGIEPKHFKVK